MSKDYRKNNPYSDLPDETRLKCFRSEYWDGMNDEQKMYLIQAAGDQYAREMGINNPPLFVVEADNRLCGSYSDYRNRITVNLTTCMNPYEALSTIAHEENHAYQTQAIMEQSEGYSQEELSLLKAEKNAYEGSGIAYSRQSLECDSNNAGARYVLSKKEFFADDPAYVAYVSKTLNGLNGVTNDYRNNRLESDNSELKQIERAEKEGYISHTEAEAAAECLKDNNNSIRAEMFALENDLVQERFNSKSNYCNAETNKVKEKYEGIPIGERVARYKEDIQGYYSASARNLEVLKGYCENKGNVSFEDYYAAKYELSKLQVEGYALSDGLESVRDDLGEQQEQAIEQIANEAVENDMTAQELVLSGDYGATISNIDEVETLIGQCDEGIEQMESINSYISQYTGVNIDSEDADIKNDESQETEDEENIGEINNGIESVGYDSHDNYDLGMLHDMQQSVDMEYEEKMQQLTEYITERNMDISQAHKDEYVINLSDEIKNLEQERSNIRYEIAKIETDEELNLRENGKDIGDIDLSEDDQLKDIECDILDISEMESGQQEDNRKEKISEIDYRFSIDSPNSEELENAEALLEKEFETMNHEGIVFSDNSMALEESSQLMEEAANEVEEETVDTGIDFELADYETTVTESVTDNEQSEESWMIY